MQQKVAWFMVGVLLGSLFFVVAEPSNNTPKLGGRDGVRVETLDFQNHTVLLLYGTPETPLTPALISQKMDEIMKLGKSRYKMYAIPIEAPGTKIIGYGIKICQDGAVEIKIQRVVVSKTVNFTKIHENLKDWAKDPFQRAPDVKAERPIGVPKGYTVKVVRNDGTETVLAQDTSEPYWHNFGSIKDEVFDPPYGNIYVKAYYWGLWNDNDPNREYFMVAGDQYGTGAYYRSDPGYELRNEWGNSDYLPYRNYKGSIYHKWKLETGLFPDLEEVEPGTSLDGPATYQLSIGYRGVSLPLEVVVPSYGMYAAVDGREERVKWGLNFDMYSNSGKYSFQTRVASVGSVSESALKDGQWHSIVEMDYEVTFANPLHISDSDTARVGWVWRIKVS
ncbi:MAG: hypothetical protein J7K57_04155 [Palaeococcus sp.]|uniref:hypothetical protein n=1 Tax=Palaeococcus sp. (in: euryarchaeotes) TaxID=2820298 RepID=UPI0025F4F179|nr:hypothetical protein [Palaeococcus sp. (in: euryarchaeotes)]MCD6559050.1 hypothetical protein [Palaeococcus sp. (in: euryarchaeotes)]